MSRDIEIFTDTSADGTAMLAVVDDGGIIMEGEFTPEECVRIAELLVFAAEEALADG